MKKFILLLLIFSSVQISFGQKKTKFKAGAKITEASFIDDYNSPKSIIFIFKGDTHFVYFYLNLQENIEKRFKNSPIKIGFKYLLSSKNSFKVDLESIPKPNLKITDFESIGVISLEFIENFNSPNVYSRRQNYNVNLNLIFLNSNVLLLKTVINVNTYNTILTQNKKVSGLIFKTIVTKG